MAFRQVQDLLEWVVEFHNQLAAQYRRLAGEQQYERMRMTLDFLTDREQRMHQSMANYLENANPNLLKTWLTRRTLVIPRCLSGSLLALVATTHRTSWRT
ncbi:hypothetical protein HG264_04620 [Pseudomonas sp. gcc21]|uniref:hypothetical protein n=1 Tax=Pseudomonas sp. gcc21 TaxID=2726989 RepID=UPI00145187B2|nr:hypothetical protein [Pseudomonas sp. gcc21]QJD58244.1 hypothetical protein HG264_04620 [Pseudomonas sp. gcc21]